MKIAVLTHYFPHSGDPWAGHSAYQTLRLLARRHQVRVFYPVPTYPALLAPPKRRGLVIDPAWQPDGVDVSYIPYPVLPVISRPFNGFSIAHALLPHIRAFEPDLLFNYVVYPHGFAAVQVGRALGVPVVLTAIGSDLNRIAPLCGPFTRQALRQATFTSTVSQDLCNTARRLGAPAERSQAIVNGCDTMVFHPQDRSAARSALDLDPDAEIVLYVGRLDVRKGLVELIEAVGRLAAVRPRLRCLIIGFGPDKPRLLAAIEAHRAGSAVTLLPPADTREIAMWMAAANLVTLPSYNEGCPNVVLEALSAGRPVVATRVGGIPELMDEGCGALVPARDVAALADALAATLDREWNAEAISASRSRSWTDVAEDVETMLTQVMQGT
jgi:teichuronic acid biosynthesis glycosyltransferase TuaC